MLQVMELDFSGSLDSSSLDSCSPFLAHDADDAMSASSWTSLTKWKLEEKIMLSTPQQSPQLPHESTLLRMEVQDLAACRKEYEGEHRWTECARTVNAKVEQYLFMRESLKVRVEELKLLLGPEDSEVDLRCIVVLAQRTQGRILQISSTQGQSEFLVVRAARWNECSRMRARAMMERKRNLMSEAPENLRKQVFQEIRDLDEKISGEDMELLETNRTLEELSAECAWLDDARHNTQHSRPARTPSGMLLTRQMPSGTSMLSLTCNQRTESSTRTVSEITR